MDSVKAEQLLTRYSSTVFACDISGDTRYIRCDFPQCRQHSQPLQGKHHWLLNTLKNVKLLEGHVSREVDFYMREKDGERNQTRSTHAAESRHILDSRQVDKGIKKVLAVFNLRDPQSQFGEWISLFLKAAVLAEGRKEEDCIVITQDFVSRCQLMECITNLGFLKSYIPRVEVVAVLSCHSSCQGQVFSCTPSAIGKESSFEEFCSLHDFVMACQVVLKDRLTAVHVSSCFTLKLDCSHMDWPVDADWLRTKLCCILCGSTKEVYETGSQVADLHLMLSIMLSSDGIPGSCGERLRHAIRKARVEEFPDLAREMGLEVVDLSKVDERLSSAGKDDCVTPPGLVMSSVRVVLFAQDNSTTGASKMQVENDNAGPHVSLCEALVANLQMRKASDVKCEFEVFRIEPDTASFSNSQTFIKKSLERLPQDNLKVLFVAIGPVFSNPSVQLIECVKEWNDANCCGGCYGIHFQHITAMQAYFVKNKLRDIRKSSESSPDNGSTEDGDNEPISNLVVTGLVDNGDKNCSSSFPVLLYMIHLAIGENGNRLTGKGISSAVYSKKPVSHGISSWTLEEVYMETCYVLSGLSRKCGLHLLSPASSAGTPSPRSNKITVNTDTTAITSSPMNKPASSLESTSADGMHAVREVKERSTGEVFCKNEDATLDEMTTATLKSNDLSALDFSSKSASTTEILVQNPVQVELDKDRVEHALRVGCDEVPSRRETVSSDFIHSTNVIESGVGVTKVNDTANRDQSTVQVVNSEVVPSWRFCDPRSSGMSSQCIERPVPGSHRANRISTSGTSLYSDKSGSEYSAQIPAVPEGEIVSNISSNSTGNIVSATTTENPKPVVDSPVDETPPSEMRDSFSFEYKSLVEKESYVEPSDGGKTPDLVDRFSRGNIDSKELSQHFELARNVPRCSPERCCMDDEGCDNESHTKQWVKGFVAFCKAQNKRKSTSGCKSQKRLKSQKTVASNCATAESSTGAGNLSENLESNNSSVGVTQDKRNFNANLEVGVDKKARYECSSPNAASDLVFKAQDVILDQQQSQKNVYFRSEWSEDNLEQSNVEHTGLEGMEMEVEIDNDAESKVCRGSHLARDQCLCKLPRQETRAKDTTKTEDCFINDEWDNSDDLPLLANVDEVLVTHYILDLKVEFSDKVMRGSIVLFLEPCNDEVTQRQFQMTLDSTLVNIESVSEVILPENFRSPLRPSDENCLRDRSAEESCPQSKPQGTLPSCTSFLENFLDDKAQNPLPYSGLNYSVYGWCVRIWKPGATGTSWPKCVWIKYHTSPEGKSLTWASDQDGRPSVYSPGAYINNRSLMPCQEPPVAMSTWQASIHVPRDCMVLMSGNRLVEKTDRSDGLVTFHYEMDTPLPCSTLALAVGWWHCQQSRDAVTACGDRPAMPVPCRLFATPSLLDRAANELLKYAPKFVEASCELLGPYPFKRLDVLILPRCFACMGLKSPNLVFLSQSLLSGDGSMRIRLAHEISHAWFGLLLGAKDWSEEWLSEGFATFVEEKIQSVAEEWSETKDRFFRELRMILRHRCLLAEIRECDDNLKCLRPQKVKPVKAFSAAEAVKRGSDQSDTVRPHTVVHFGQLSSRKWTQVHYLKGYFLLHHMADMVGLNEFYKFLFNYMQRYKGQLVTSEDFFEFFVETFSDIPRDMKARFNREWLESPRMPKSFPKRFDSPDNELISQVNEEFMSWKKYDAVNKRKSTLKSRKRTKPPSCKLVFPEQVVLFLEKLLERDTISHTTLRQLDNCYKLSTGNAEIRHRWCELIVKHKYNQKLLEVKRFLIEDQGMGIYLFGELIISQQTKQRALVDDVLDEIGPEMDRCTYQTVKDILEGND